MIPAPRPSAQHALVAGLLVAVCLLARSAHAEEWFDAYEAGQRLLRAARGAEAAERFERAIRLHPVPGRNVLTYGTNRLTTYHPYLRLAEAWLVAGDAARARAALARSQQRDGEPADERARLAARLADLETRLATAQPTASPPSAPPATQALAPPATAPPATLAAAATPQPSPVTPPVVASATNGTLELRSTPAGARVSIDGRRAGSTPLVVELPAGRHEVALTQDGTAEQRFAVRIDAGRRTTETRALIPTDDAARPSPFPTEPAPVGVGTLIVYSQPPGATVYVDDEPLGQTDPLSGRFVKTGLRPGPHAVRLTARGHVDLGTTVEITTEAPGTWRATLAPAPTLGRFALLLLALACAAPLAAAWLWRRRRRRQALPGTGEAATVVERTLEVSAQSTLPQARGATPGPTRVRPATPVSTLRPDVPAPAGTAATDQIETHALIDLVEAASPVEIFGEYRLLELLGKGGMAAVHKAERHGELLALKRPLPAFLDEPEFLQRFAREADIGRTLHHPNIVRIVERGSVGATPYFTMELIAGETLHARLRREGRFAARAATRIVLQVAEALDYAHLKGVVHRDLKPSNIMLLLDGTVKVMDYGIARARRFDGLTLTGHFLGTPDYVAPETAEGRASDARSDLYALGVIFYELLTGRRPFVADTPFALLRKHCSEAPTPPSQHVPDCPPQLEAAVLKLMAKSPDERHPGAEELLIELRDYLNHAA